MADRKGVFLWYEDAEQFDLLTDEQLGQLIRALINYSKTGIRGTFDDRAVAMAFSFLASRDDRDGARYEAVCEKRREAGKKGGRPPKANALPENQEVSLETKRKQKKLSPALTSTPALTPVPEQVSDMGASGGVDAPPSAPAPAKAPSKPFRKQHGQYGWVRLTDVEYDRLVEDLGTEELERCIRYIDESAQANGNKNKWKDWNLVIRKCSREGWGLNRYGGRREWDGKPDEHTGSSYGGGEGKTWNVRTVEL